MTELSPDLFALYHRTLLRCREFESDRVLRAFMQTNLSPFNVGLPEANSLEERVDLFFTHIQGKSFSGTEESLLVAVLAKLRDRYDPADSLCHDLDQLYARVSAVIDTNRRPPSQHPYPKHQLFDHLLRLNFRAQVQAVRQVIDRESIAAFLIHGQPDYGQRILAHRLTRLHHRWETGQHIILDAGANGIGKSSRSLWREIAQSVKLPVDSDHQILTEKIGQWWRTKDVIFVIHTVDYIPITILRAWLDEFWKPLVNFARQSDYFPQASTHLLLFMVDYSGSVCQSDIQFIERPEDVSETHIPLLLPPATVFPETEMDIWLDTASEVLPPPRPTVRALLEATQNGIPDLVYEEICRHCHIPWQGELAP
ncbi:MAG TPA: hypothetical protein VI338_03105 [Nitrososphaera sp.]|nr:hypothetical protein [Nitrososphaera sp.]